MVPTDYLKYNTLFMLGYIYINNNNIIISHTTLVGMTLILVSFFISHTTSFGMTLILVSFFLINIILIILATKWSGFNFITTSGIAMRL